MQPDDLEAVLDILHSAGEIQRSITGLKVAEFERTADVRDATLYRLAVIGEAVNRLSREFREEHAEVAWAEVVGMRNIVIHAYHRVFQCSNLEHDHDGPADSGRVPTDPGRG